MSQSRRNPEGVPNTLRQLFTDAQTFLFGRGVREARVCHPVGLKAISRDKFCVANRRKLG